MRVKGWKYIRFFYYPKYLEIGINLNWERSLVFGISLFFWELEIGRDI